MAKGIEELPQVKNRNISAILNYDKKFIELNDYLSDINTIPIPISILRYRM